MVIATFSDRGRGCIAFRGGQGSRSHRREPEPEAALLGRESDPCQTAGIRWIQAAVDTALQGPREDELPQEAMAGRTPGFGAPDFQESRRQTFRAPHLCRQPNCTIAPTTAGLSITVGHTWGQGQSRASCT